MPDQSGTELAKATARARVFCIQKRPCQRRRFLHKDQSLLGLMRLEGIAEAWAHADVAALMAKAWATGHKEACASWGERWVASMTILVGDAASVKETLGVDACSGGKQRRRWILCIDSMKETL